MMATSCQDEWPSPTKSGLWCRLISALHILISENLKHRVEKMVIGAITSKPLFYIIQVGSEAFIAEVLLVIDTVKRYIKPYDASQKLQSNAGGSTSKFMLIG
jgi:hypothetical protein